MYDKQLDSGKGTLLHLCDDVIQQEVSFKLEVSLLCYRYYGYNDFNVRLMNRYMIKYSRS